MSKGTNFISEIGKYFKENDATSAMNKIMDITRTLNLSEKRLFGEESRCNCKYTQLHWTCKRIIEQGFYTRDKAIVGNPRI